MFPFTIMGQVSMKAMVHKTGTEGQWLVQEEVDIAEPGEHEVLVRVGACGVCRTDLHIVEEDLPPLSDAIVPGHEIIGTVERAGKAVSRFAAGDTAGIMWLHAACGRCDYCISGRENLCPQKVFTGYSVNGGYAEYALGREEYMLPVPAGLAPEKAAPLMCSGIIGYRALKLALPGPAGRLGIFGFGGSAHLTVQLAAGMGMDVCVVSRSEEHLKLASQLGASETIQSGVTGLAGLTEKFDSAIVFAPSGNVVKQALESIRPGGKVAVPAVHLDRLPEMDYNGHLFNEKKLFSVEANTRADAKEFLEMALRLGLRSEVEVLPFDRANTALEKLKHSAVNGAVVLRIT